MKSFKRVISVVLCALMMVGMLATCQISFVFAASEGDYTYNYDADETYAIVTKYNGTATDVTIPATLGGKPVGAIEADAFKNCAALESVVIPASVTAIGDAAFRGCVNLESVTMPTGTYKLGLAAFAGCSALKTLDLQKATSVGVGALSGCTALEDLSMRSVGAPKGETGAVALLFDGNATPDAPGYPTTLKSITLTNDNSIEAYAFKGIESLETVTLNQNIVSLGASAFEGCSALKAVNGSLRCEISDKAFFGCAALTAIDLSHANVTLVGTSAFEGCAALATITVSDSLKYVKKDAFKDTAWLKAQNGAAVLGKVMITFVGEEETVTVPAAVKYLADSAFEGNVTAQKIVIPDTVEYIGINVMKDTAVVSIEIPYLGADNTGKESPFIGYLFGAKEFGENATLLPACLLQVELTGGAEIAANAFAGCRTIMYLYLPATVTKIGAGAFANCPALTKLGYNAVNATVDSTAFNGSNVDIIELGKQVEVIPTYLCTGNANLTTLDIPASVTTIQSRAFAGCYNLALVKFNAVKCTSVAADAFDYCHKLSEIELGKKVTFIPANLYSLYGSSELTELTIPATVTEIAAGAFANCVSLKTLNYNAKTCVIGDDAFTACTKLENVNLGDDVTTIPTNLYTGNTSITSVEVPGQITRLDDYAFSGCTKLNNIVVPETLLSIGKNTMQDTAWYNNQPDGPIYLGKIFYGYKGNMEDETLVLKDGTTAIADSALAGNGTVKTITIPGTVTHIGADAFAMTDASIINNSGSQYVEDYATENNVPVLSTCNHDDVYYVVTAQPTATEPGTMDVYCKECGEKFSEAIFTSDNDLLNLWILTSAPTCTDPGVLEMNTGSSVVFDTLPATEHTFITWKETVAPSCTEEGVSAAFCDDCGEQIEGLTGVIAKVDHIAGEWQKVRIPRTYCTGMNAVLCTECGEMIQYKILPKLEEKNLLEEQAVLDVQPTEWYYETVNFAMNNNLFSGMDANYFGPNEKMNRAMFVTVLGRLDGVEVDNSVKTKFTDVKKNQYYTGYVSWAAENDIVSGITKTTFGPTDNITREQICALIVRYCDYAGIELDGTAKTELFRDADMISDYALESVLLCHKAGIVTGRGDNYFAPKANATRAEVAQVFRNLCEGYLVVE
ncbi:MAG: leucine-rich repeat protein [Clostridia bacterium]|nr:leucine-rich repeat protein [Clostridia bacterium]